MKKIYNIILVVSTFALFSCEEVVDIQQPGLLGADNAIENVSDYNSALNGIYGQLDNTTEIIINSVMTDELSIGLVNGGQNESLYQHILTSNSFEPRSLWTNYYVVINNINKLLEIGSSLKIKEQERESLENVNAQLLALRAYCHFQLLTYFSTDLTDDNALGVIKLDVVPGLNDNYARSKNVEIYQFIKEDLDKAFPLLKDEKNRIFVSKDFVTALRTRVAAYRGRYDEAITNADILLNKYQITPRTDFEGTFLDSYDQGIIFELERVKSDPFDNQGTSGGGYVGSLFAFGSSKIDGSPFMEMSRSLFNLISDDDIRKSTYIDSTSKIDPNYTTSSNSKESDVLVIKKYPGHDNQPLMNDIKIFRIEEILLIKAEALASTGKLNEASQLVKKLRDNRHSTVQSPVAYGTEKKALIDILKERRVELALEGFRWVDLKRLGTRAGVNIDRDPVDCSLFGACTLLSSDYRYTLPIPLREIDLNSSLEQNPNY